MARWAEDPHERDHSTPVTWPPTPRATSSSSCASSSRECQPGVPGQVVERGGSADHRGSTLGPPAGRPCQGVTRPPRDEGHAEGASPRDSRAGGLPHVPAAGTRWPGCQRIGRSPAMTSPRGRASACSPTISPPTTAGSTLSSTTPVSRGTHTARMSDAEWDQVSPSTWPHPSGHRRPVGPRAHPRSRSCGLSRRQRHSPMAPAAGSTTRRVRPASSGSSRPTRGTCRSGAHRQRRRARSSRPRYGGHAGDAARRPGDEQPGPGRSPDWPGRSPGSLCPRPAASPERDPGVRPSLTGA